MRLTAFKPSEQITRIYERRRSIPGAAPQPRKPRSEWRNDVEAYCLKCRTQREMKDATAVTMKNGKPATKGVCPTCGTGMYKIGKAK